MKKVRLNLKKGVKSWSFVLYDSAESAYYLRDEPVMDDEVEEYRRTVTINRGETIEAEWLGAEWIYDEDCIDPAGYEKFDRVRLGKIVNLKSLHSPAKYLELYSGWVTPGEFPWKSDDARTDVRITPLKGKSTSKLDFSKLFLSYSEDPEEDSQSPDTDRSDGETFVN